MNLQNCPHGFLHRENFPISVPSLKPWSFKARSSAGLTTKARRNGSTDRSTLLKPTISVHEDFDGIVIRLDNVFVRLTLDFRVTMTVMFFSHW